MRTDSEGNNNEDGRNSVTNAPQDNSGDRESATAVAVSFDLAKRGDAEDHPEEGEAPGQAEDEAGNGQPTHLVARRTV